jgi:hypothetical protein
MNDQQDSTPKEPAPQKPPPKPKWPKPTTPGQATKSDDHFISPPKQGESEK